MASFTEAFSTKINSLTKQWFKPSTEYNSIVKIESSGLCYRLLEGLSAYLSYLSTKTHCHYYFWLDWTLVAKEMYSSFIFPRAKRYKRIRDK